MTKVAMLGCGYVSNMYRMTLACHSELDLVGVFDKVKSRREYMAALTGAKAYENFNSLLDDPDIQIVMNLTNPHSHYETTKALLKAGKHVYTEKPLAMRLDHAKELTEIAYRQNLFLVSAPCTILSPVAQTLWQLINEQRIGSIRLIYAEMEDGMVHRAPTSKWVNEMGIAWPTVDEFETGCTVEHAGYVLSWLCAMFGPVKDVSGSSHVLIENKIPGTVLRQSPDFSVSIMRFKSGPLLRMTNGIYAQHDHGLKIFGDDGVITVKDPRNDNSALYLQTYHSFRRRRFLGRRRKIKLLKGGDKLPSYRGSQSRDFCRAIADMAAAHESGKTPYTSARFALHLCELTLAAHYGTAGGSQNDSAEFEALPYTVKSDFPEIKPLGYFG